MGRIAAHIYSIIVIGMMRNFLAKSVLLAAVCALCAPACADTVKLTDRPAFLNVRVIDYHDKRLHFRGVSRQVLRKPLAEVEWLAIDELPDFTAAEQALITGDWTTAADAYERALGAAPRQWLASLISCRLVLASDRAGRFDRAVALLVQLESQAIRLPEDYVPRLPGPPGDTGNRRALATLTEAIATNPAAAESQALARLRLELQLYEGVLPDSPTGLPAPGDSTAPKTTPTTTQPAEPLGLLPATGSGAPPAKRPANAPLLDESSLVLEAARAALTAGNPQRAGQLVSDALPFVGAASRSDWLLVLGLSRLESGQHVEAAATLLEVAADTTNPGRAATALYQAGIAHERLGRSDVAYGLYGELLERPNVPAEIRTLAEAGRERVRP